MLRGRVSDPISPPRASLGVALRSRSPTSRAAQAAGIAKLRQPVDWYVYVHGFAQPSDAMLDSAAGLVNFHEIVGQRFFVSFYNTFNSNLFAAIPSPHSGYPTAIALFVWLRLGGRTWLFLAYPLLAWFAAAYLNHHYIIDLILGSLYVMAAWVGARTIAMPLLDRILDYESTSRLALRSSFGSPLRRGGARR